MTRVYQTNDPLVMCLHLLVSTKIEDMTLVSS